MAEIITMDAIQRLNKDLREAAKVLTPGEARYLVDAYYTVQEYRKSAANQVRATNESGEPNELIEWFFKQYETLENNIKKTLDIYTNTTPVGVWCKSITGIGPVIAAGLLAHIDITKAPTVGHIWNFAGLNPEQVWNKGQKRPWNARLKVLCWKIGESFVKVSNKPNDIYGKIYKARKEQEWNKNLAGDFSDQAMECLKKKDFSKSKTAKYFYNGQISPTTARELLDNGGIPSDIKPTNVGDEIPMLSPAHIQARACRYAVKLFLAHLHEVWYRVHYNEMPPKPYVIEHLGHAHKIEPPNLEVVGL